MGDKRDCKKHNVVKLLRERENTYTAAGDLQRHAQVTENLIKRLGLEHELEGHKGCVNCIEWSHDGRRLASGSDDTKVIIWDPFRHRKLHTIHTPHIGNIFSVKFLGGNCDPLIASGAGDCHVVVQSVIQEPGDAPILHCLCHAGRVKRIATAPDQPQVFWSAGEDGLILQYDLREPHQCISGSTVFLDLTHNLGWAAEAKCLSVNPVKPHMVAIGANDCFVRIYDRRMVKTMPYRTNHHVEYRERTMQRPNPASIDVNCVQYYAPGHLAKSSSDIRYKLAVTYISFDPSGTELLVNMGGEQIYLFDLNNSRNITEIQIPEIALKSSKASTVIRECCSKDTNTKKSGRRLSVHNCNILNTPCACQYLGRASTLFERKWIGDVYAAARDYLHVIKNWSDTKDAYLGLVRCLIFLKWKDIASDWLTYFRHRFIESANSAKVLALRSDLAKPVKTEQEEFDENPVLPEYEIKLRDMAYDFESRYIGHCNTTTDIKEANFFGPDGQYIVAGSDDGIFFIWDRQTTNIVRAMWGDVSIVNCVQPHPTSCLLATSGIDPFVKLWTPLPDGVENIRVVADPTAAATANQQRISTDPFETMLANMGYRVRAGPLEAFQDMPTCRTS